MAWVEGYLKAGTIIKDLATIFTNTVAEIDRWELVHPATIDEITTKCILSTTTSKDLTAYVKFERPSPTTNFHYMEVTMSDEYSEATHELTTASPAAKYFWYKNTTGSPTLADWLPVAYWANVTKDKIAMTVMGDPSASFTHYLTSFAYIGMIESFAGSDDDSVGNFGMTVGSGLQPAITKTYGDKTANGVTDIIMLKTRSGFPYQAHLPGFDTVDPFMDKHFVGPSTWMHKYPASQISVVHGYDNRRGKLIDVLAMDRSGVVHADELIEDKGLETEKTYKFFNINAPFSMFNNSANVLYGVAIRKG